MSTKAEEQVIIEFARQFEAAFTEVEAYRLDLSDDESDYDLIYIGQRLAKCSASMEQIGHKLMALVRWGMELRKYQAASKRKLQDTLETLKGSDDLVCIPKAERSDWLKKQSEPQQRDLEAWTELLELLETVSEAARDKMQLMKRLDSDIRLHQKLLEAKIAVGAMAPQQFGGSKVGGEIKL